MTALVHPIGRAARRDSADWARLVVAILARALIFSVVAAVAWPALASLWGWKATTVMSDSMASRILAGDIVVSMPMPADSIQVGRVVLVQDPDHPGRLRLHRYVGQDADGRLILKGDANPSVDSTAVQPSAVFGVAVIRSPWVASPLVWAQRGQWSDVVAVAAALVGLALMSRADVHLRRRRIDGGRVRERLRRAGTRALIAGVVAIALALVSAGGGAHAALTATTSGSGSFASAASIPCFTPTVTDTPYFYYPVNEASGTSATDVSGNGRTATLGSGVSRTAGSCASGASPYVTLDGTANSLITTGSTAVQAPSALSIEVWFRTSATKGGVLVSYDSSLLGLLGSYDRQLFMSDNGKLNFGVSPLGNVVITSPTAYNNGQWHHAIATIGSGGMALWVDNVQVATNSNTTAAFLQTGGYWRIGYDGYTKWGSTSPTSGAFQGSMDDVALYSTALSATRVAAHYSAGRR